jgi:hypothetical protein
MLTQNPPALNFAARFAPPALAATLTGQPPFEISLAQNRLEFSETEPGLLTGQSGALSAAVRYEYLAGYRALAWEIEISNTGTQPLSGIDIRPLYLPMALKPPQVLPRVRHLSGSWHYDACYPPRAFRVLEEAFMTHDHSKPLIIGGKHAGEHVPILQFAIDSGQGLSGFFTGFEWSGAWELRAGWQAVSWSGEEISPFIVQGTMALEINPLQPGQALKLPKVQLGFFEGTDWTALDNAQRRYIREKLSARLQGEIPLSPVSYDHWFGIYKDFDLADLMGQAARAAELSCEYFCLDAAWYTSQHNFMDGVGNWDSPDPRKFPQGKQSIKELSRYVRSLGMGFGLWHLIQLAMAGTDALKDHAGLYRQQSGGIYDSYLLKLETPEGVDFALDTLRGWIREWDISWLRFESVPEDGLAYNQGYNRVIDALRREFPRLYLETCNGGGQRLDLNMAGRTHGNWLSDHTSNPEVTRFMQTGALRFWPPHFLNMAVTAFRGHGDAEATAHQVLSRMVGTLSFNGDIAQWSSDAVSLVRRYVELFKAIRPFQSQPVFFPLPQPRRVEDWDAVIYGDSHSTHQLLFVFRTLGEPSVTLHGPWARGEWRRLAGSSGAALSVSNGGVTVHLPACGSALWLKS